MTGHQCTTECVTWTGTNKAHCSACGETFSTVPNFDTHRSGSKDRKFRQGECSPPAVRGMVVNSFGVWKKEGEPDFAERIKTVRR